MHATDFGRTIIIANPVAQSGAAREVAERLQRFFGHDGAHVPV